MLRQHSEVYFDVVFPLAHWHGVRGGLATHALGHEWGEEWGFRMGGFQVRAEGRVTWPANLGRVEERPYVVSGVRSAQCARRLLP